MLKMADFFAIFLLTQKGQKGQMGVAEPLTEGGRANALMPPSLGAATGILVGSVKHSFELVTFHAWLSH